MGRSGDDPLVESHAHPDSGERGSFDPGLETGYLRRAPRDHELSPELGAVPFDPGPERYDDRRARRAAKRRARTERQGREREAKRARAASADATPARRTSPVTPLPSSPPADPVQLAIGSAGIADQPPARASDELAPVPRRHSMAERLERERAARERAEHERRGRIEQEREQRERAERERLQQRRRQRAKRLRRERRALRRPTRPAAQPKAEPSPASQPKQAPSRPRPAAPTTARVTPSVEGPVRKRARAAENRRRAASRRRGLAWPTAKAGLAVTVVLAASAVLGSALGLPVPILDHDGGDTSLASSASLFGVDQGTPEGLTSGYVFPLEGPHNFGQADARFGASRYGHVHEGQDIFGKVGTSEVAVHDGIVVDRGTVNSRYSGGRGNYLAIYSPADNHSFVYMHMLHPPTVQLGDHVHAGQLVGQLGCTGSCDGPHLHFEVRIGKASLRSDTKAVDPLPYLRRWPQPTPG